MSIFTSRTSINDFPHVFGGSFATSQVRKCIVPHAAEWIIDPTPTNDAKTLRNLTADSPYVDGRTHPKDAPPHVLLLRV